MDMRFNGATSDGSVAITKTGEDRQRRGMAVPRVARELQVDAKKLNAEKGNSDVMPGLV